MLEIRYLSLISRDTTALCFSFLELDYCRVNLQHVSVRTIASNHHTLIMKPESISEGLLD